MAIQAIFRPGDTKTYTKSVYQYDKNQRLTFIGIPLPNYFQVHFSVDKDDGIGTIHRATPAGIVIPDEYLAIGKYIRCWIYIQDEEEGSGTRYEITIPVIPKPAGVVAQSISEVEGATIYPDDPHTLVFIPKT